MVVRSTIEDYASKAEVVALIWEQLEKLSETELETMLFSLPLSSEGTASPLPNGVKLMRNFVNSDP